MLGELYSYIPTTCSLRSSGKGEMLLDFYTTKNSSIYFTAEVEATFKVPSIRHFNLEVMKSVTATMAVKYVVISIQ